jgi:enterobacterial common antigen flippase
MSSSYRQIFKAATVLGGAQVINIFFGLLRNKFLAVLVGPAGVGLAGLYQSVISLVGTVTGLGIPMSGVREIADADGKKDERRLAVTVRILGTITWAAGLIGMCGIIIFADPISAITFKDHEHIWGMVAISAVVLIEGIGAKQKAILQGLRRVTQLSACNVIGAIGGTVAAIPLIVFFKERGVAGFIVVASLCATLGSWWFARQIKIQRVQITRREFLTEFRKLMNIGVAGVVTGMMGAGVLYLARLFVHDELGMAHVGLYQATWTLSSMYVGVVLSAMGTDFYPRLTAVVEDRPASNRLINEQTEMGVLITLPGVLATIVLAPWILQLVYSREFIPATDVIRWQILGVALKVVSWPLGFIALAKGRGGLFIAIETSFAVVQIALLYFCIQWWGFEGAGVAMFLFYVLYAIGIFLIARVLTGFSWTSSSQRSLLLAVLICGGVFALCRFVKEPAISLPVGLAITVAAGWWCLRRLNELLGKDFIESAYQAFAGRLKKSRAVVQNGADRQTVTRVNGAEAQLSTPASATEEVGFYESGGEQIYYVFHRARNPVAQILLPGHYVTERPFAYALWVRWARYLAEHGISALRFDYRGCGESTGQFERFTLTSWTEDCRTMCALMQERNPGVPIVLGGVGLGGLLSSRLFRDGVGSAMLLWSPSASGAGALRDTLLRRLAFDMANPATGRAKSWSDYEASLARGESMEAAGYTLTPELWREASETKLILPEGNGMDVRGRPWKIIKLGQAHVPLVPGGGLWQALNPGLRVRRAPLNPDLNPFFNENVQWIQAATKENRKGTRETQPI